MDFAPYGNRILASLPNCTVPLLPLMPTTNVVTIVSGPALIDVESASMATLAFRSTEGAVREESLHAVVPTNQGEGAE